MKRAQTRRLAKRAKKGDAIAADAQNRIIAVQEAQIRDLKQQIAVLDSLLFVAVERTFDHIDPFTGEVSRLQLAWPQG
jgi:triosephosphate isomerase